jgi:hypothetical protein
MVLILHRGSGLGRLWSLQGFLYTIQRSHVTMSRKRLTDVLVSEVSELTNVQNSTESIVNMNRTDS